MWTEPTGASDLLCTIPALSLLSILFLPVELNCDLGSTHFPSTWFMSSFVLLCECAAAHTHSELHHLGLDIAHVCVILHISKHAFF